MPKFNFKKAIDTTAGAVVGGAAAGYVNKFVDDNLPQAGKFAPFIPIVVGAFLAQKRGAMIQNAGVGMIGAAAPAVLSSFGIMGPNPNRLAGGKSPYMLNAAEQKKLLQQVQRLKQIDSVNSPSSKIDYSAYMEAIENDY